MEGEISGRKCWNMRPSKRKKSEDFKSTENHGWRGKTLPFRPFSSLSSLDPTYLLHSNCDLPASKTPLSLTASTKAKSKGQSESDRRRKICLSSPWSWQGKGGNGSDGNLGTVWAKIGLRGQSGQWSALYEVREIHSLSYIRDLGF